MLTSVSHKSKDLTDKERKWRRVNKKGKMGMKTFSHWDLKSFTHAGLVFLPHGHCTSYATVNPDSAGPLIQQQQAAI